MPLPGKFCVGILEEDNPLKSYFRFKPLLVEQDGRYVPFGEYEAYPKDGCLRIVPDKNESARFKARMREIGLFAVVDLTAHPNRNDKIRDNKNFRDDDVERNASILYSDVVREPADGLIYSVLSSAEDASPAPLALLCPEETLLGEVWRRETDEEGNVRLVQTDRTVNADALQRFDLPGFREETLSFCVDPSALRPAEKPEPPKAVPAPEKAEKPAPAPEEKPWICHSLPFPPPADPRLTPLERVQCGLNPRRGRSLQEIIDDKWRRSRFDQLGHSVPELTQTEPAENPVEKGVEVLRSVWRQPELRGELIRSLSELEGMNDAMEAGRAAARQSAANRELNDLEAQRLELLADLDKLRRGRAELREKLKQEIRRDEAASLADAVEKTRRAREEQARCEQAAQRSRAAAETAEDAIRAMSDGRFEKRLQEFCVESRAAELLGRLSMPAPAPRADGESADAETLVARVMETFAAAGRAVDRDEAVHWLVCASQSPVLLLSGPAGCGKTQAARLLAAALGAAGERFRAFAPGEDSPSERLPGEGDAAAVALLDDANLSGCADPLRGLSIAAEEGRVLVWATLQDEGMPVSARIFDRAFTLRLEAERADSEWKPAETQPIAECAPVSRGALREAFAPQPDAIPETLRTRMDGLRRALGALDVRLSRRTLTALWNACAAEIPRSGRAPSEILDRALAERALPAVLASAPMEALTALPKLLEDFPRCRALLRQPLPIRY